MAEKLQSKIMEEAEKSFEDARGSFHPVYDVSSPERAIDLLKKRFINNLDDRLNEVDSL